MEGSWVEIRTERDHSPATITGKTDSTWGKNLIHYKSNQSRIIRKNLNLKTPLPPPFLSPRVQIYFQFLSDAGGWGMGIVVSSPHVVSAALSSSVGALLTLFPYYMESLPAETSFMTFSTLSPFHIFHELLQHGFPMGSQVLAANLPQHRLSMGSQPPLDMSPALEQGLP